MDMFGPSNQIPIRIKIMYKFWSTDPSSNSSSVIHSFHGGSYDFNSFQPGIQVAQL